MKQHIVMLSAIEEHRDGPSLWAEYSRLGDGYTRALDLGRLKGALVLSLLKRLGVLEIRLTADELEHAIDRQGLYADWDLNDYSIIN